MASARPCLKAFFPRGPRRHRVRALLSFLALALLISAALAANYALATCGSVFALDPVVVEGTRNPAAPAMPRCLRGAPVNCATGNQTEEQTDLALAGRGPALQITRTYNSLAAAEAKSAGIWGYGWSGPYSSHLEFGEAGSVTVVQENGAGAAFSLIEGKYVPGDWIQATLVKEGESYVFTLPSQEKLKFNSEGWLTEKKDRNGNAVTISRIAAAVVLVKDAGGRELKFAYTEGRVASIEDPLGRKVKYAYESGHLASVTMPGDETPRWKFKYDASHRLTEMTDGRGGVTKTAYDEKNRAKEQTDPMGRVLKFAYGESGGYRTTTITEPNGSTTFQKFNGAGGPLEVIKAKGTGLERKTSYEYDSGFRPIKVTDALGHATTYAYNAAGDRTLEKDPEGNETKWTYNSTHDVLTETTPKGESTTFKRDVKGNVEAIERPAPLKLTQKSTFKYATNGDLQSTIDPLGRESKFEYDTYGNVKAAINPAGDKTTWTYNKDGEQLTEVSPRGNEEGAVTSEFEVKTERDAQGRPIKVTDPLGHETKFAYDKNGNLESTTNALGHTTKYTYNADDEQTKVEEPNGSTTGFTYGSMGEVKSQTNSNGKTTKYEHDVLGQPTETIDPLERKSKREYDVVGNLKKTEDALGRTISYAYDNADRLKGINYSEASTADVAYIYDKNSNIVEMVDGIGTTINVYDQLGRLTEVKNGRGEVVKYAYDLGSQQTEIVYPNGNAVKRAFDKAGRLEKVTDWLGKEIAFSYSRDSQLKATTFPATTTNLDEYAYNRAGELTSTSMKKGAEVLASLSYGRDKAGQLTSTSQKGVPGPESLAYEYDPANRLVKGAGYSYEYDPAGNRTKEASGGWSESFTYDAASQLVSATERAFTYNKVGQRVKYSPLEATPETYAYDQAGNLISVQRSGEFTSPINETYKYDGSGLRVSESVAGTAYPMVWDATAEIPLLLTDGRNSYIYGPDGLPIEQISSVGQVLYLHHDQQGSTRLLTGSTGKVEGAYAFGPYGTTLTHTGTASTPLGYRGEYRSPTSGLIYLRARVYDPDTAQFLSVDPLVSVSAEPYGYGDNDPMNRTDSTGLLADGRGCDGDPVRPAPADATVYSPRASQPCDGFINPVACKYLKDKMASMMDGGVWSALDGIAGGKISHKAYWGDQATSVIADGLAQGFRDMKNEVLAKGVELADYYRGVWGKVKTGAALVEKFAPAAAAVSGRLTFPPILMFVNPDSALNKMKKSPTG
jgi:RHS repeat-associated protein